LKEEIEKGPTQDRTKQSVQSARGAAYKKDTPASHP
jgi:LisH domain-containing protein ARMC9